MTIRNSCVLLDICGATDAFYLLPLLLEPQPPRALLLFYFQPCLCLLMLLLQLFAPQKQAVQQPHRRKAHVLVPHSTQSFHECLPGDRAGGF